MTYDHWTIAQGRQLILDNRENGIKCPCCSRLAKVYRNPINSSMVLVLISMRNYYRSTNDYRHMHVPSFINSLQFSDSVKAAIRGHWPKLRYWGLLVEKAESKDDGNPRAGFWCITQPGLDFAEGKTKLPAAAFVYQKECLGFDTSKWITIQDALKKKFNYTELMSSIGS